MGVHDCKAGQATFGVDNCPLLISAYVLAGLAMMLNIRLSYSSAPYALIRFRLPENLFSVFVRRMASALELWCLPSMLLGNIIDLIQKLIDKDPELRAIIEKAKDIKDKSNQLNSTATSQSGTEITNTRNNDIQGTIKGSELTNKARDLKNKASDLHDKAGAIVTEAATSNPLKPLQSQAQTLKYAAGSSTASGDENLFKAAKELELESVSVSLEGKATNVIAKFEAVKGHYETLTNTANRLTGLTPDQKQKVTDVDSAYTALKAMYDGMLNFTKLKDKATALNGTSEIPSSSELNSTLSGKATELATMAQELSDAAKLVDDRELSTQAGQLRDAAKKTDPLDTDSLHAKATALASNQDYGTKAKPVIQQFDKVKTLYDSLIKAAITNGKLSEVQNVITKFNNLKTHYDTMLLFTKIKYYSDEISNQAGTLRTGGTADNLVKYFESMKLAYNTINDSGSVKTPFEALNSVYDLILNVSKMKHYSDQVYTNAPQIATGNATPSVVKTLIDTIEKAYNTITYPAVKNEVQTAWENLKDSIDGEMKRWKFYWIIGPSIVTQWLNFLTYVLLLVVYLIGGDTGHLTTFYFVIAISGVVFGINMTLIYSVDFNYIPVYIAGENTFPMVTSFMHYLSTLIFGNRRKYNSDFIIVNIDIWVAILISFVAAVVWTCAYLCEGGGVEKMKHIYAFGFFAQPKSYLISPCLMVIVGMGLVYAIYPGIAPGMIVPFYLIDKIEMVLLIATAVPPVIIAILRKYKSQVGAIYTPACIWGTDEQAWGSTNYTNSGGTSGKDGYFWHAFDLLMVLKISLAAIFIYSLHYRDSSISRSIINQPKMSTFLSIIFYMCHEILLAFGFTGIVGGNSGGDLVLIPQYIGALFMIFLAFYSEGYIIEYKSHDPAHWPTEGMTK